MKISISEMGKLSGVSVRTLHYYDEIGLLKPSDVVLDTGYRYYNEGSMECLQQILFYRELDFSLKEISKIINSPDYNKQEALKKQFELLKLKRKRMDQLIALLNANLKGEKTMSFNEFDMSEIQILKETYAKEVENKWGNTDAYKQSQEKTKKYTKENWSEIMEKADAILKEFAGNIGENPRNEEVQKLVLKWQQFITDSYYDCTKEILAGLGEMYTIDQRFTENMDRFGVGTAAFMSLAIAEYCKK